jgi:hypothetical protein
MVLWHEFEGLVEELIKVGCDCASALLWCTAKVKYDGMSVKIS